MSPVSSAPASGAPKRPSRPPGRSAGPVSGSPSRRPSGPGHHHPSARHSGSRPSGGDRGRAGAGRPSGGRGGNRPPAPRPVPRGYAKPIPKLVDSGKTAPEIKPGEDVLRFVPLGGLEEIGRNCSFYEYKDEIIIIDVGIQFPEEDTPGIDYIIPNATYLQENKHKIRAVFLTHGHYDHIAAIHYVIEKIGNPMIYTADFTKMMVEKRHQEFVNAPKLNFQVVKHGDHVKLGKYFEADFFNVDHTIPDALGFTLHTPVGKMVSFGDFRVKTNKNIEPIELDIFEKLGKEDIHTVFIDSTNALREGFSSSEMNVQDNLEELIKGAKGRVIVAMFSSLLTRLYEIVVIAAKYGRKVAVNGRSMRDNLMISQQLGYFKPVKDQMIQMEEVNKFKDDKVLILTTGGQGEANSGLMRMVTGEHRSVNLKQSDTVIFSSSVVPGNERSVQALQDNIARQVDELYNTKLLDIHTSGHAHQEDLKLVLKLVKPRFVVPIHGYYFFRSIFKKLAEQVGISRDNVIVMDNGEVANITKNTVHVTDEKLPASYVMVDGLGVGDVEEVVLRDRLSLAQEGMLVIIMTMSGQHGRLLKNPDIISRGFIFIKEHGEILEEIRAKLRSIVGRLPTDKEVDPDYVKTLVRDQISQFLYNKTKRRPMILPVVIRI